MRQLVDRDHVLAALISHIDGQKLPGEVPVSALVLDGKGELLSWAGNERESLYDPTGHAEILAIRRAAELLRNWRLDGLTLVSSLAPCLMCSCVIRESRISRVFYLLESTSRFTIDLDILRDTRLAGRPVEVIKFENHQLAEHEAERLRFFFQERRGRGT